MSEAHDVGPLAEEAAKLLGVLSGWARDYAAEAGDGLSGLAERAASALHDTDDHLATGAPECTVCPLCSAVQVIRQINPEVTTHLALAVTSLAQAAAALVGTPGPVESDDGGIEHIAIDDD